VSETRDTITSSEAPSDLVAPSDAAPIVAESVDGANDGAVVEQVGAHVQKGPQQGEMPFAMVLG